jgi:hypothetical protein
MWKSSPAAALCLLQGILLWGPPGTGKTLSARAVANRTDACFIRVIGGSCVVVPPRRVRVPPASRMRLSERRFVIHAGCAQAPSGHCRGFCVLVSVIAPGAGSELVQKYVGEGARMVRELFQMARSKKACIIFFDEVGAVWGCKRATPSLFSRMVGPSLFSRMVGHPSASIHRLVCVTAPLFPVLTRVGCCSCCRRAGGRDRWHAVR